jgi:PilZ domain
MPEELHPDIGFSDSARAARTPLSAPVKVRAVDQDEWLEGVTCNISRTGILIETKSKLPPDTPIEITFLLRRKGDTPLQMTAHVVRVEEPEGAMPRVAARFAAQMGLEIFQKPGRA